MSKKLTTSTNDVLDTLALDDTIQRIDTNGNFNLHIKDDVKVQQYAIYGNKGEINLTFERPVVAFTNNPTLYLATVTGFSIPFDETNIVISLQQSNGGVSIVYCFGLVFINSLREEV